MGKLAQSVGAKGDFTWSCEAAAHLYSLHVKPPWKAFKESCFSDKSAEAVQKNFPFSTATLPCTCPLFTEHLLASFFADVLPLFSGESFERDLETARGCFRHIKKIFTELEVSADTNTLAALLIRHQECRPLELLRSGLDRANYLLIKQARIVAMTCTHAALKVLQYLLLREPSHAVEL